ncbi:S49 family peptidase [Frateuria aurantia]|uniref:ClpP class periplasmic serine protease n=1 Tax=Frateuria aurantia (strain ATCC 33424 / DSM 6220 / KCTC 2777 / LMG 1558 / NBRC 3245 / NCIMB 13370) TaxID=767434 RepID=H8L2J2_FRAAD|nr:S49 family peptidase [Frateuria aurantia]AFC85459.1 ClpP class periplasmic serine protease [Frateuria aurantia DSM 6220]
MINLADMAAARPWLMMPQSLERLLAIADRQLEPQALETRPGDELRNTRTTSVRDGVAIVPVTGPIFRYANLMTRICGATSTQVLATDIQAALDDPSVRAIVLDIDSPGGEANGINELAEMIFAARGQKPIVSYVGGTGASAGYWIASAADEIVADETAVLGSIGVVLEVMLADDAPGKRRLQIVSQNAPNKRPDLKTEEGQAKVGDMINSMARVFEAKVARNRGVALDQVGPMGDHGGVRIGADAVAAGLADRLGSLESVVAELSQRRPSPFQNTRRSPMGHKVSSTEELQQAISAGVDPATIELIPAAAQDDPALAQQAAAAERARIQGINALARPGFEKEVAAAIESGMPVAEAALSILTAAGERGITLEGIAADATHARGAAPGEQATAAREFNPRAIWSSRKGAQ